MITISNCMITKNAVYVTKSNSNGVVDQGMKLMDTKYFDMTKLTNEDFIGLNDIEAINLIESQSTIRENTVTPLTAEEIADMFKDFNTIKITF